MSSNDTSQKESASLNSRETFSYPYVHLVNFYTHTHKNGRLSDVYRHNGLLHPLILRDHAALLLLFY
jgi:hypothetical protein